MAYADTMPKLTIAEKIEALAPFSVETLAGEVKLAERALQPRVCIFKQSRRT